MDGRICFHCQSSTTYDHKGNKKWHTVNIVQPPSRVWYCHKCYCNYVYKVKKPKKIPSVIVNR